MGEFFEGKPRYLGDNIVNAGFKGSRRNSAGYVVLQFIKSVTHREFCGDFCNRESRRLRGQSRRARYARVHFNHHHPTIVWINAKLNIGSASLNTDFAKYGDRCVTQNLIFLIRQRLRRRDGNAVTCVNAHRIDVFNGADNDAIVSFVSHHLHLELFPTKQRLINQQFAGGGKF